MKLLKILGVIVAAIVLAKIFVFPDYRHRFRLTIEFDTPDGVKSASGVHEVVRKDVRWVLIAHGQYEYSFHGEAIFLDLGRGKHVVALLAHGPTADLSGVILSMGIRTYFPNLRTVDDAAWSGRYPTVGSLRLPEHLVPTMVTFSDVADPRTARVVLASGAGGGKAAPLHSSITVERAAELLGPGYGFRSATIERVASSVWPLDVLGIYGEPITRGIVNWLPALNNPAQWNALIKSSRSDPNRVNVGSGAFLRNF